MQAGARRVAVRLAFCALVALGCSRERSGSVSRAGASADHPKLAASGDAAHGGPCACDDTRDRTAYLPLDCFCSRPEYKAWCPATLADFDAKRICSEGGSVGRADGCGRIATLLSPNYVGSAPTFDGKTKALVGIYQWSDIPDEPCDAFSHFYGQVLFSPGARGARSQDTCAEIKYCTVCGPYFAKYPPCRD